MIAEARKVDPDSANAYGAEALLLQREGKQGEADAAFVKAARLGSTTSHVHYRAAISMWGDARPDEATLRQMETHLVRATELNPFSAESYAALAEVRSVLKTPADDIVALLTKAVNLDPSDAWIRITAARTLQRLNRVDEARQVAHVALMLAGGDARAKAEAERLLAAMPESAATSAPGSPSAPSTHDARTVGRVALSGCQPERPHECL